MTEPISIGRAIAGVDTVVVTDDGRQAGPGEVGELLVGGPTVMQGYWGDADRTKQTLVPHPFGGDGRVYRTGDLVKEEADGTYTFLGRRDAQIKCRGYRIELGEIETALHAHPGVVAAAAVPVPDELVSNLIKAVVVVRDGSDQRQLAAFCAERLPKYMVPEIWEFRDHLPQTSTGKVDRQALLHDATAGAAS
jgi:acyl-coenzyme A synthetase/AMP-(fatty) acid ligase